MELNVIYNEDCRETMKRMEDNSIDSIVTDPPYGISFMGKKWDTFNPVYINDKLEVEAKRRPRADAMNKITGYEKHVTAEPLFNFDLEYIVARARMHGVKLRWGRDGSQPRIRNSRLQKCLISVPLRG